MNILQVVIYPLDKPMHGGQIRCHEINRHLKSLGHSVTLLTILDKFTHKSQLGPNIVYESNDNHNSALPVLAANEYLLSKPGVGKLSRSISAGDFDLVWVDQPFAFKALHTFFKQIGDKARFVYSSQNIETDMYRSIFERSAEISEGARTSVLEKLSHLEIYAACHADLVLGVTESDCEKLRSMSGSDAVVKLLPNASNSPNASAVKIKMVSDYFDDLSFHLFVGSAHDPNVAGFEKFIGYDLTFIQPNHRLVLAGGVGRPVLERAEQAGMLKSLMSRVVILESVDTEDLAALRLLAKSSLLPIIDGGGSNLKTAEALLGPSPIIASRVAFRGYERWANLPDINLVESREQFQSAIRELQEHPHISAREIGNELVEALTWHGALSPISSHLERIAI